ncbi:hypothetical protein HID58_051664 [Brassica napus]|uniref:K-box domain-containing protein n=1 Tax=Brassica napus TaxID=3708 RepID=A0ABQ8A9P7_BRANA|nr:hypothetical protein HID58_051664 [Brassica napus]
MYRKDQSIFQWCLQGLEKILDRYGKKHADDLNTLDLQSKSLNYSSHHELLELVESKLVESIVDVSVDSLVELEDHLETALSVTRAQKAELMLKLVESLKEKVGLGTIGRFKYLAIAFLASSARRQKEEVNMFLSYKLSLQIEKKKLEGAEADNIEMSSGQISNIKLPVTLPLLN